MPSIAGFERKPRGGYASQQQAAFQTSQWPFRWVIGSTKEGSLTDLWETLSRSTTILGAPGPATYRNPVRFMVRLHRIDVRIYNPQMDIGGFEIQLHSSGVEPARFTPVKLQTFERLSNPSVALIDLRNECDDLTPSVLLGQDAELVIHDRETNQTVRRFAGYIAEAHPQKAPDGRPCTRVRMDSPIARLRYPEAFLMNEPMVPEVALATVFEHCGMDQGSIRWRFARSHPPIRVDAELGESLYWYMLRLIAAHRVFFFDGGSKEVTFTDCVEALSPMTPRMLFWDSDSGLLAKEALLSIAPSEASNVAPNSLPTLRCRVSDAERDPSSRDARPDTSVFSLASGSAFRLRGTQGEAWMGYGSQLVWFKPGEK